MPLSLAQFVKIAKEYELIPLMKRAVARSGTGTDAYNKALERAATSNGYAGVAEFKADLKPVLMKSGLMSEADVNRLTSRQGRPATTVPGFTNYRAEEGYRTAQAAEADLIGETAGGSAERTMLGSATDSGVSTSVDQGGRIVTAQDGLDASMRYQPTTKRGKPTGRPINVVKETGKAAQRNVRADPELGPTPGNRLSPREQEAAGRAQVQPSASYDGTRIEDAVLGAEQTGRDVAMKSRYPTEDLRMTALSDATGAGASSDILDQLALREGRGGLIDAQLANRPGAAALEQDVTDRRMLESLLGRTPRTTDAQTLGADVNTYGNQPAAPRQRTSPTPDEMLLELSPGSQGRYYERPLIIGGSHDPVRPNITPHFGTTNKFQGIQGTIEGEGFPPVEILREAEAGAQDVSILRRAFAEPDIPGQQYAPGMEDLSRFRGERPMPREDLDARNGQMITEREEPRNWDPNARSNYTGGDRRGGQDARGNAIPPMRIKSGPMPEPDNMIWRQTGDGSQPSSYPAMAAAQRRQELDALLRSLQQ